MKNIRTIRTFCLLAAAIAIIKVTALASDASSTARFVDSITVAPVAALRSEGITGPSTFGSGVDLGVGINSFVSVHLVALGFESKDHWRGSTVDEGEAYGKATFARFANESFSVFGKGGVNYDFQCRDFGMGVGLGAELKFNKTFSLASDFTVRSYFTGREKDSLARALLNVSF